MTEFKPRQAGSRAIVFSLLVKVPLGKEHLLNACCMLALCQALYKHFLISVPQHFNKIGTLFSSGCKRQAKPRLNALLTEVPSSQVAEVGFGPWCGGPAVPCLSLAHVHGRQLCWACSLQVSDVKTACWASSQMENQLLPGLIFLSKPDISQYPAFSHSIKVV